MARLLTTGFELNDAIGNSGILPDEVVAIGSSATITNQASTVRSGSRALKVAVAGSTVGYATLTNYKGVLSTTRYFRCYLNIDALPSSTIQIIVWNSIASLRLASDGTVQFWDDSGLVQVGSDSVDKVSINGWHMFEIACTLNASSKATYIEGRLNGVSLGSKTGYTSVNNGTGSIDVGAAGSQANAINFYLDDVGMNDSSGASQTSWLGEGKVVLLIPTADSAVGTGWTLGTGTATGGNAHGSVDNEPPQGAADLAALSDPKQIRNATSNANSNYDATMTTYSAAGLGSNDTVNVVVPIVATAAPVVTSAKAGTVGVVSNPAIANIALGAGGTAGAFWSGLAGGTYPSGWKWSYGTITYAPAVTVGTAPVMRITQVTSSTRIAVVCFMGIYVDYTPTNSEVLEACLSRRLTSRRGVRTVKV